MVGEQRPHTLHGAVKNDKIITKKMCQKVLCLVRSSKNAKMLQTMKNIVYIHVPLTWVMMAPGIRG